MRMCGQDAGSPSRKGRWGFRAGGMRSRQLSFGRVLGRGAVGIRAGQAQGRKQVSAPLPLARHGPDL